MADFDPSQWERKGKGARKKAAGRGSKRASSRDSKPKRSYGRQDESRGRSRRDLPMVKAVCSECGKKCELPFKPTQGKPVLCKDCFGKSDGKKPSDKRSSDLSAVHEKLDKIMKALKIN